MFGKETIVMVEQSHIVVMGMNVGKSSLINMLVRVKGLAKTSARPGKTQLINHFLINENWFLVDLPGYGYARTSKVLREDFSNIIKDNLKK
jgi:GTP-binding protein